MYNKAYNIYSEVHPNYTQILDVFTELYFI